MMKRFLALILVMMMMFTMAGCQPAEETQEPAEDTQAPEEVELQKVVFTLDWFPNTNHTGIYVAKEMGYFEEMGLDVEIIQPSSTAEQLVASDSAQFGISYQEAVTMARAEGIPIVSVAAVIQHNTSGFMSISDKGIASPADFEGKKYGGWGSPVEMATIKYLMDQEGADSEKVEVVTIGDVDFFAASESGDVDFAWVFEGWSVIEAKQKGFDVNYVDLGKEAEVFDYYTPVIITSEKNIEEKPELVENFMKAAAMGYEFAIANPEEAAQALLTGAPELNETLVIESQKFLADKYTADAEYWGYQDVEVWSGYTNWLLENEFIANEVESEKAFTNDFLNK
jgi:ABC-type nitrate/sulfonate/bicarbonate transport system substrate-binding protein